MTDNSKGKWPAGMSGIGPGLRGQHDRNGQRQRSGQAGAQGVHRPCEERSYTIAQGSV